MLDEVGPMQRSLERRSLRQALLKDQGAELCNGCGFSVEIDRVSIKGDIYHTVCFKCSR